MPSVKNDSFPGYADSNAAPASDVSLLRLDLRGVKCPLNWAHAKVRLESMRRGEILELTIDDPRGARDIPRAAEAEGYAVGEVQSINGVWYLRIEK
jgi:TusA-related sulfurtransferase